jgi:NTP pyrophosphatase (non-canonical NTP hydrolase)
MRKGEMSISKAQEEEYLKNEGGKCPGCGCVSFYTPSAPEVSGTAAYQNCRCELCGLEWTDEYTLTGISEAEGYEAINLFSEYQARAYACALNASKSVTYMAFGLANEAGEVLGKLKKALRDDGANSVENMTQERRDQVVDELGDVL